MRIAVAVVVIVLAIFGCLYINEKFVSPYLADLAVRQEREKVERTEKARAEGRLPDEWNLEDVRLVIAKRAESAGYKVKFTKIGRGGNDEVLKSDSWEARMPNSPTERLSGYLQYSGECSLVTVSDANGKTVAELVIKNLDNARKLRLFCNKPGRFADRADGQDAAKMLDTALSDLF